METFVTPHSDIVGVSKDVEWRLEMVMCNCVYVCVCVKKHDVVFNACCRASEWCIVRVGGRVSGV